MSTRRWTARAADDSLGALLMRSSTWGGGFSYCTSSALGADHDAARSPHWRGPLCGSTPVIYPIALRCTHGLDVMGGGVPTHGIERSRPARPQLQLGGQGRGILLGC